MITLALALAVTASCSWDAPRGMHPVSDPAAVVDNYTDIPRATRAKLKERIAARKYDEVATIRRDTVQGEYAYAGLRDMHFGDGKMCREVRRDRWTAADVERGLVYCEDGHCLIVPTVCRNTSRITRGPRIPPAPFIAEVDPLPVRAVAPIPDVVAQPLDLDLPRRPFAFLASPQPPAGEQILDTPEPEPEGEPAALSFLDLTVWRPLFGPTLRLLRPPGATVPPFVSLPPVPGIVPVVPVVPSLPTVPGVPTPPAPFPLPPPEIGTAIMVPCTGVQLTLPATQAEIAALCPSQTAPPTTVIDPPDVSVPVTPVPEPATWALMAGGLIMVLRWARGAR